MFNILWLIIMEMNMKKNILCVYMCVCICTYIGLAKKFIVDFPKDVTNI